MARREKPYLPLYVQDFLTDEKLIECSAESTGVYIRLMCLLHKSETYGAIELSPRNKRTGDKIRDFALKLSKHLPFDSDTVYRCISELSENDVIQVTEDVLSQRRMLKDGHISEVRAQAGSQGGKIGRNSGTKRYYNEPGYLYLIYDKDDPCAFKVGISATPEKRIKGIIRTSNRENLAFRRRWSVFDMGEREQDVLDYFDDIRDGEWIYGDYDVSEIEEQIDRIIQKQNKSKPEANKNQNADIDIDIVNDIDIDVESDVERIPLDESRFSEFWQAYPKKIGKQAALKAWKRVKVTAELHEKILDAIRLQKTSAQWQKDNGQFIPNPATWLNQGRWDDEIKEPTDTRPPGKQHYNPFLDDLKERGVI
jgi:hypothetical protein